MDLMKKVVVIVPAFNEAKTIGAVLDDLKSVEARVIVIDDGSTDSTRAITKSHGVAVFSHAVNRGLGASLQTGFKKAIQLGADYIVTFDADGQHRAKDITRLVEPIASGAADAVIGTRDFSSHAPHVRKIYNSIANVIGYLVFGIYVHDTQSGLRAFRSQLLARFGPLGDRMEISSEIIGELKRCSARLQEVSIKPIYTSYSLSKGQSFKTGIKTAMALIAHKLRGL